ncbi:MAG: MG2 domain-containing protein [bacterium]
MRNKKSVVLVLLWLGLMAAIGLLWEKPVGSLSGRVFRSDNGAPLAGAKIFHPSGRRYTKTRTDGTYLLTGVEAGAFDIYCEARGMEPSYRLNVRVREGRVSGHVDFKMVPRASEFSLIAPERVFIPGEKVTIHSRGYLVKTIELTAYLLSDPADMKAIRSDEAMKKIDATRLLPVYQKNLTTTFDEYGEYDDTVVLPLEKPGLYLLKARPAKGSMEQCAWISISDLGLICKNTSTEMLAYAFRLSDRRPLKNVSITAFAEDDEVATGLTDSNGLFRKKISYGANSVWVIAREGDSSAFLNAYSGGDPEGSRCYVYTERPIYRPGQTVFFKAILRTRPDSAYTVPAGRKIKILVTNPLGNTIHEETIKTNEFGSVFGNIELPPEVPLGDYNIEAQFGKSSFWASFAVSEYRKPEFSVEVTPEKKQYVGGQDITARVKASYYFGGAVKGATLRYRVYESAWHSRGIQMDEGPEQNDDGGGSLLAEGTALTDENGTAHLLLPSKKFEEDRFVGIEVEAEDLSHRTVTGEASVLLTRGLYDLWIETDRYLYEAGKKMKMKISARGYEDPPKGRPGVHVLLKLLAVTWEEGPEKVTEKTSEIAVQDVTTDRQGNASASFALPKEGEFRLVAESKDELENTIQSHYFVWVSGWGEGGNFHPGEIRLIADKKTYKIGDVARMLICSSVPNTCALLTIEGRRLFDARLIFIEGYSKTILLPVEDRFFPNASVHVLMVKDKQLLEGQADILIPPLDKFLKVSIKSDKAKYQPGDTALYQVRVTDRQGEPVEAEVSLGLVDEAVYALQEDTTPDMGQFFYHYDYNCVGTSYSFENYYYAGSEKESGDPRPRKKFVDTAFWEPAMVTDDMGTAEAIVVFPDNLTTWRATARAVTLDTETGSAIQKALTSKDLLVRLELPRFLRERDAVEIAGVVHNYTGKDQKVKVSLSASGVRLLDPPSLEAVIAPKEARRFAFRAVAEKPGGAIILVKVLGDKASDAVEDSFQILPHGFEQLRTQAGNLEPSTPASIAEELPSGTLLPSSFWNLYLNPSVAGTIMESIAYLTHYPYGCVEQTMSGILPAALAAKSMERLGIPAPPLKEIPKMVKASLERLASFQQGNGGWGWWTEEQTDPWMTAYVVSGLSEMEKAGYAVDTKMKERGIECLKKLLKNKDKDLTRYGTVIQGTALFRRAFLLYALSRCGKADASSANELYRSRAKLTAYGKALLALILKETGEDEKAVQVAGELEKAAINTPTTAHWDSGNQADSWTGPGTETTAYVLKALLNIKPESPAIASALRWLLAERKGLAWSSTRDTAAISCALIDSLEKRGELKPDLNLSIYFNDEPLADIQVKELLLPENQSLVSIPTAKMRTGPNAVRLDMSGQGSLAYSSELHYFEPGEVEKPQGAGISVSREYFRLKVKKEAGGSFREVPLKMGKPVLSIGERLQVQVVLTCGTDLEYLIVEDPIPAGCEVALSESEKNQGWGWSWCRREVRDEKVAFFARSLTKGKHTLTYILRAEIPGEYHVMPAQSWQMYLPEVRGSSAEDRLQIR